MFFLAEDFASKYEQSATFFYANAAPRSIAVNARWQKLEQQIRQHIAQ